MTKSIQIGLLTASLLLPAVSTWGLDKCKAKIKSKDGTIFVDAKEVDGTLLWGHTAISVTNGFADPACVDVVKGKAKKCTLGAEGTAERITPPPLCTLYLADDSGSCSAFLKKCTPGVRSLTSGGGDGHSLDSADGLSVDAVFVLSLIHI